MFHFIFMLVVFYFDETAGERKVMLGNIAKPGQFPYVVSLRLYKPSVRTCSGSIISETHIVSAAHCFYRYKSDISKAVAVVGTNTFKTGGKYINLESVVYHSKYNKKMKMNDISVIKTLDDIQFNNVIQKISLRKSPVPPYSKVTLSGWGCKACKNKTFFENDLTFANVQIVPQKYCIRFWKNIIVENHICAFSLYGQGQCPGDSGGPLVYRKSLVGIAVSSKICDDGMFDIYTDVTKFTQWIQQAMEYLSTSNCQRAKSNLFIDIRPINNQTLIN